MGFIASQFNVSLLPFAGFIATPFNVSLPPCYRAGFIATQFNVSLPFYSGIVLVLAPGKRKKFRKSLGRVLWYIPKYGLF